ncbi:putative restriction endonuclease [Streptomyces sp. Amel2xB2]|uniref:Uma2 family endonuclease n=1 Tax=Streptomyces sp. Amel2xB2 TaxID=1305829 RepID=UPI000DBA1E2E|nr:Uma2 family endonuclease [Streptomyces sp. Amel2xB2]RAJ65646.1 putative restriction endonuclease [Streptomyces sp. Amel2xB2]
MTVELTDRTEMADSSELSLDALFELLERMPVPEGYKAEIVEGTVHMSPQRDAHWEIIRRIVRALEDRFGMDVKVKSDVRIDFPGHKNGFAPDVAKLRDAASPGEDGRWRYQDIEFVAEVISRGTGQNDYGPKLRTYAAAGVPVYLIADPYVGRCHLCTQPKGTAYRTELTVDFGTPVDLTATPLAMTLPTAGFPRDRGAPARPAAPAEYREG